jgi:hypothetical protein
MGSVSLNTQVKQLEGKDSATREEILILFDLDPSLYDLQCQPAFCEHDNMCDGNGIVIEGGRVSISSSLRRFYAFRKSTTK